MGDLARTSTSRGAPIGLGGTSKDFAGASRIAGESRIVVEIPNGTPFMVSILLNLATYQLVLDDRALPQAKAHDMDPDASMTAIEVPTSLILRTTRSNWFVADTQAITHWVVTQLWCARLSRVVDNKRVEPPFQKQKSRDLAAARDSI